MLCLNYYNSISLFISFYFLLQAVIVYIFGESVDYSFQFNIKCTFFSSLG